MKDVRRLLRRIGVGTFAPRFLVILAVSWIVIALAVANAAGRTERIFPMRSGMYCYLNPCPPLPKELVLFRPAVDAGIALGFLFVVIALVAWSLLGRWAAGGTTIEHRPIP